MKRKKQRKNLMLTRSYARLGWFVLGVGLLACSCAKEPDETISTGDDDASLIVPEALVGDVVETETKADLSGVVIGTSFPANYTNVFSVVGYKGTTAPTTNWSSPYINDIAVNSGTNGTLSFATPQYYPANGDKVFFYAYSPVSGATFKAGSGSTAPTVTWTLNGHTDVMAAQVTTGIAKAETGTQSQPSFAFTHKLMQLKFKVMKDPALTDLGNVTALTVNNAAKTISMNLSNGNITTSSTGSITAYSSTTGQAVTTTAAYLGTNGSPFLTTKTNNLTLTLTCTGENFTITPDLPADAGPGKTVEITLKLTPLGMVITSITLNSSSSVTIPRAGGTFTLATNTETPPFSNISWLVKDADDNEVGRSTSYSAYNSATVKVDENKSWNSKSLTLYWSYNGSEYKLYDGPYTLKQNASNISSATFSVGATSTSNIKTYIYKGVRTLQVKGDWSSGAQIVLTWSSSVCGPFTLSSSMLIIFPENFSNAILDWNIRGVNPDGTYTATGCHLHQGTDLSPENTYHSWDYINGLMMLYLGKKNYSDCYNQCAANTGTPPQMPSQSNLTSNVASGLELFYADQGYAPGNGIWRSDTRLNSMGTEYGYSQWITSWYHTYTYTPTDIHHCWCTHGSTF